MFVALGNISFEFGNYPALSNHVIQPDAKGRPRGVRLNKSRREWKRKKREELSTGTFPSGSDDSRRLGSLISQLLRQRPDLTRDSVMGLVEEKKKKVGGGYLTDQGALFLVASELGAALTYNHPGVTRLADVAAADASSLNVVGRILSLSPPKSFTRKTDSKQGVLSRIIVYDDSSTMPVSLWDE